MEKFLQFIRKNRALLILIVSVVACAALVLPAVLMLLPPVSGRAGVLRSGRPHRCAGGCPAGRRDHTRRAAKTVTLRGISTA